VARGGGGVLLLAALAAGAIGCSGSKPAPSTPPAARVVGAGARARVVLSAEAERRLGITTALVRRVDAGNARAVVPFAALLYDAQGRAFTFVAAPGRGFERRRVGVAAINGHRVTLTRGPRPGARVVTTGGAELLGAQQGVQAQ
jgi:hypothetical protein